MKKILAFVVGLALAVAGAAGSFLEQLTSAERAAAGVRDLTPDQQAALNRLAERFAQAGARATEEKVRAETKVAVEHEQKQRTEARAGLPAAPGAAAAIRSRLKGTFNGWSGRTVFHLENGQQWMQADKSDEYWVAAQAGPEVELRESSLGGWKLYLVEGGRWVRVKRIN